MSVEDVLIKHVLLYNNRCNKQSQSWPYRMKLATKRSRDNQVCVSLSGCYSSA